MRVILGSTDAEDEDVGGGGEEDALEVSIAAVASVLLACACGSRRILRSLVTSHVKRKGKEAFAIGLRLTRKVPAEGRRGVLLSLPI